ncbi:unannotated protein [freshwater metagenome]|uniref:Unannotated protein n=1 Tax=freshwater metagenome TaxID=449393 RepID=A0A6J7BYN4_9ZZZZ
MPADDRDAVHPRSRSHTFEHHFRDIATGHHGVNDGERHSAHRRDVVDIGQHRGHSGAVGVGCDERRPDRLAAGNHAAAIDGDYRAIVARALDPPGVSEDLGHEADFTLGRERGVRTDRMRNIVELLERRGVSVHGSQTRCKPTWAAREVKYGFPIVNPVLA